MTEPVDENITSPKIPSTSHTSMRPSDDKGENVKASFS